ncbi:MAG: hypothetical protein H6737_08400 [Alphaproteobacteria bacterium]|nr:hypothetical protein [Alphaproteobacteria bacterium]
MDGTRFEFDHPWYGPLSMAPWVLAAALAFGTLGAVIDGYTALWLPFVAVGLVTAWGLRRIARWFAPVVVTISRHRVRIEQAGVLHGDLLIERLDGGAIHDVVLYVLRAGHGGNRHGFADALQERLEATRDGKPLDKSVLRQLAQLRE